MSAAAIVLSPEEWAEHQRKVAALEARLERLEKGTLPDRPLTAREVARFYHRRDGQVIAALQSGELHGTRRGRRWEIDKQDAERWARGAGRRRA